MSKKYFNDDLGNLVLSTFTQFNDKLNKVLETESKDRLLFIYVCNVLYINLFNNNNC